MFEFRCDVCGQSNFVEANQAGQLGDCQSCGRTIEIPFPPLELPLEVTTGGSVVHRHEPGFRTWEPTQGREEDIECISDHIEQHLGEVEGVFHELVSDQVHVDIHVVAPTPDRPYRTLVTSGMSDLPMTVPDDADDYRFSELMLCLPEQWPLSQTACEQETNYWPIRWLKRLARFPHAFDSWLFFGHTIPNGDPPQPLSDGNPFSGWIVQAPQLAPEMFRELEIDRHKTVRFAAIYPIFQEEMELKLDAGSEVLFERLSRHGVTELVDLQRRNVALADESPFE